MTDGHTLPFIDELVPPPDPAVCCERLSEWPYRLFLDSAAKGSLGRHSFLTADPVVVVRSKGAATEIVDRLRGVRSQATDDALGVLRTLLGVHRTPPLPDLPPFQGGAAGYIAYDWG